MANEKLLIALDDLLKFPIRIDHYDKEHGSADFVFGVETVLEYAENLPTVDAVEVVRCKDCIYYETKRLCMPGGGLDKTYECGYCYYWKYETGESPNSVEPDDFCSYGERKDNEALQ